MATYILYKLNKNREMEEFDPPIHLHSIIKAETRRALEENYQRTYVAEESEFLKLKQAEIERKARYEK